jgi:hypothetical protein
MASRGGGASKKLTIVIQLALSDNSPRRGVLMVFLFYLFLTFKKISKSLIEIRKKRKRSI